jgi:hypothetical protein
VGGSLVTTIPPPSAGVRYGSVPCWKIGSFTSAWYSS